MIFYGINPLLESLHSPFKPQRIYVQQGKENPRINGILKLATELNIPIEYVPNLDRVCGDRVHQGVAGEFEQFPRYVLRDDTLLNDQVVVFDGIQDPHNFGAAMRVCDAFGFPDIIYHKGNSSGLTPAAIKVSTGAVFHLRLFISNLNNAVKMLQDRGYRICPLEANGTQSIYDADYSGKFCLVIGSEGAGVRNNILRQADTTLTIPMYGKISSLNVSCALSAVLCQIARHRART